MLECPTCGAANPSGSRFCNACGTRLAVADEHDPGGERRLVTMLFCDVRGSTSMAEEMDAEEWTDVMNAAYEVLIAPVVRHEGTVARLMGDAILAFFGAPTAHEDDPQRAVMAGLEIVAAIVPLRERLRTERGLDLDVRVGINTGPVVVGQVGSEHRQEYSAMGDAVNVAARMEQTAEPGTVQITEDTYRLVEGLFEVEALGRIDLKGKREPVGAYRVRRRSAAWKVRAARALEAPLIGRDAELATIRAALERTGDGVGSVILLVGEPGIGKSRLVEEANAVWQSIEPQDDRGWDFWQCVPYDAMQPHAQYRRAIRERAGIAEGDPPEVVRSKIAELMEAIAIHGWDEESRRVTRALLGVQRDDEEPLEGEAFHRAARDLVVGSTIAHGGRRLIVFEDLHWCDHASLELIRATIDVVPTIPYVFLATYRPDRDAPSWAFGESIARDLAEWTTEIRLEPLSADDSERLIAELLPDALSGDVRRRVLEKSEGSPLFVQEIARALLDRGVDEAAEVAIPDTVQSLITVGLDRLPGSARRTLQTASVIGRTFDADVLRAVLGNGEVEPDLRELATRDLIRPSPPPPPGAFTFRHALTQEAAYSTLLVKRRRAVHLRVAEALEAAGRLEDRAAVLAYHFAEAGDDERALRYAIIAADSASRLYANAEAEAHYRTAIDIARRMGVEPSLLRSLYERRGTALEISARHADAVANYDEMRDVARVLGDEAMELSASSAVALLYSTPSPLFDAERGRALSDEIVTTARRLGDRDAEARAWWNILVANIYGGGDPVRAVEAGEASLAISRDLGRLEQTAFTLNDLTRAHLAVGDFATGAERLAEARGLWLALDNEAMLGENLSISGLTRFLAGDVDGAFADASEALAIAERMGNRWGQSFALMAIYRIELHRGEVGTAIASMERCIEDGEAGGFAYAGVGGRVDLAHVRTSLGDPETALELAARAHEIAVAEVPPALSVAAIAKADALVALGDVATAEAALAGVEGTSLPEPDRTFALARAGSVRARGALAVGEPERAAVAIDDVLAMLRRNGVEILIAEALVLLARARLARVRFEDADRAVADAIERAERLDERLSLMDALALAAELPSRSDTDRGELRARASAIAEQVADGITQPSLRAGFLRRAHS